MGYLLHTVYIPTLSTWQRAESTGLVLMRAILNDVTAYASRQS